jgi:hypothetical protein
VRNDTPAALRPMLIFHLPDAPPVDKSSVMASNLRLLCSVPQSTDTKRLC